MLATDGEDLLEHAVVGRPGDGEELGDEVAAGLRVAREGAERHDVGVVGRHRDEAVVVDRVGVDPVLRAGPRAGRGVTPDAADVLADVLAELLAQQDGPLAQLAQPVTRRLVAVDARAAEVAQRALEHAGRVGVEAARVEAGEDGIQLGVEAEVGVELLHLLGHRLGALAHGRVGVHLGEERTDGGGVGQRGLRVVPDPQHLERLPRRVAAQALDEGPRQRELLLAAGADPVEPVARRGAGAGGWARRHRRHCMPPCRRRSPSARRETPSPRAAASGS